METALFIAVAVAVVAVIYGLMVWAGRIGDELAAGACCPRCASLNVYQCARENGPPGWKCHPCGWEWPGS
jgi:transposase-like protein